MAELKKEIAEGTNLKKPQKMKIENMNMPFYQLTMEGGTLCDLNGKSRVTRVNYVCYPAGNKYNIASQKLHNYSNSIIFCPLIIFYSQESTKCTLLRRVPRASMT